MSIIISLCSRPLSNSKDFSLDTGYRAASAGHGHCQSGLSKLLNLEIQARVESHVHFRPNWCSRPPAKNLCKAPPCPPTPPPLPAI